jgi:hypothetical protein
MALPHEKEYHHEVAKSPTESDKETLRAAMGLTEEQKQIRERYVLALIEATYPLQQETDDREVTLELLIQAAEMLKEHLQNELAELREEQD